MRDASIVPPRSDSAGGCAVFRAELETDDGLVVVMLPVERLGYWLDVAFRDGIRGARILPPESDN